MAGDLRADRAAAEARTCASLVERIAGRALESGLGTEDDDKDEPLHPALLEDDPTEFYLELDERLTPAHFERGDDSRESAASRVVDRCRSLIG